MTISGLANVISHSAQPATQGSLLKDLQTLGVEAGDTLIVHSSLSRIGFVAGGAMAVILALEDAVTAGGTIAMPAHSGDFSDPAEWTNPPVPPAWIETIRQAMPVFQPDLTPTSGIGIIPEYFRKREGVLRSPHPQVSWCAKGPCARQITEHHPLPMMTGETSPMARLYDLDARVLFIGTGYLTNTCFHLAEYRNKFAPRKMHLRYSSVFLDGKKQWAGFEDIYLYDRDFEEIGAAFEKSGPFLKKGKIGQADACLFSLRECVDFSVRWMNENRWLD